MGEALDFHIGEPIIVAVEFDSPHRIDFACAVKRVWEDFIDVELGNTLLRFPRQAIDCTGLEISEPAFVNAEDFDQHWLLSEYDPESEAEDAI